MKNTLLFLALGTLFVLPSLGQSTWNNSTIETKTSGVLSVGTLNQSNDRTINLYTTGATVNPTISKYGIYNNVDASGNGIQYGIYNRVGNNSASGAKYGIYTQVSGTDRAYGIYSFVPCNGYECYAAYLRGKVVVNATTAPDLDAFGVWRSTQTYSFLVKRDGRTFANTLTLGETVNVNDLNGTIRFTSTNGFEGHKNGSWSPLGGAVWDEFNNDIAYTGGNVYIGTTPGAVSNTNDYKLLVDGKVIAEEVRVQLSGSWPDYVFEESYDRLDWQSLASFVKVEKHLPGVPSAKEVEQAGGVDLGTMDRILLEKVEELTLYMLELKEENENLKKRIQALENTKENE